MVPVRIVVNQSTYLLLSLLIGSALIPLCVGAETRWVLGVSEGNYRVTREFPVPISSYRNAGFQQVVSPSADGGFRISIESRPGRTPLGVRRRPVGVSSAGPRLSEGDGAPDDGEDYLLPIEALPPEAMREARRLRTTVNSRLQLVEGVLYWLAEQVRYETAGGREQDPLSVYTRRTANCVGMTRMAVAMLRSAGVPSRSLHGYQLWFRDGEVVGGAFHRALEIEYPGVGWTGSDVGRTINFLPADFVVLGREGAESEQAGRLVPANPAEPFHRQFVAGAFVNRLLEIDRASWPAGANLVAAWSPGRSLSRSAVLGRLVVRGEAPEPFLTELEPVRIIADGWRGHRQARRIGADFSISGLGRGTYELVVETRRGTVRFPSVRLGLRELLRIDLDLSPLFRRAVSHSRGEP